MMAQDNTKLRDFSNTNNNAFISTPIAPITDAESCEINAPLLNLVMKDQFSGLPTEYAATHLNNFVDLCDMQKKKDVDNDIVKLKLFPFLLRDHAITWFSSLPKNTIDSWNKCKDAFIVGVLGIGVPRLACLRPTAWLHQRPCTAHLH